MGESKSPDYMYFFQGKFEVDGEVFPGNISHGLRNIGQIINIPEVEKGSILHNLNMCCLKGLKHSSLQESIHRSYIA